MLVNGIVVLGYCACAIGEIVTLNSPVPVWRRRLVWLLAAAALVHLAALAAHFVRHDWPQNAFWLSFASLAMVTIHLVTSWRFGMSALGVFVLPLSVALVVLSEVTAHRAVAATPGSSWTLLHAALMMLGYSAFVVSFVVALLYLHQERRLKARNLRAVLRWVPPLEDLDKGNYHLIRFGFAALTLAIATGLVGALATDVRKTLTDPTVILTVLTWILYAALFQLRQTSTLRGRKIALLALIALVGVVFSWAGASLIGGGVHQPPLR